MPVSPTFRGYSRQQDARSRAADMSRTCNRNARCRGNQRKPEGEDETRWRTPQKHIYLAMRNRKEKMLLFERSERCQNRRRSGSRFVNSHQSAGRLPVETSVSPARVNFSVTHLLSYLPAADWQPVFFTQLGFSSHFSSTIRRRFVTSSVSTPKRKPWLSVCLIEWRSCTFTAMHDGPRWVQRQRSLCGLGGMKSDPTCSSRFRLADQSERDCDVKIKFFTCEHQNLTWSGRNVKKKIVSAGQIFFFIIFSHE